MLAVLALKNCEGAEKSPLFLIVQKIMEKARKIKIFSRKFAGMLPRMHPGVIVTVQL